MPLPLNDGVCTPYGGTVITEDGTLEDPPGVKLITKLVSPDLGPYCFDLGIIKENIDVRSPLLSLRF